MTQLDIHIGKIINAIEGLTHVVGITIQDACCGNLEYKFKGHVVGSQESRNGVPGELYSLEPRIGEPVIFEKNRIGKLTYVAMKYT